MLSGKIKAVRVSKESVIKPGAKTAPDSVVLTGKFWVGNLSSESPISLTCPQGTEIEAGGLLLPSFRPLSSNNTNARENIGNRHLVL